MSDNRAHTDAVPQAGMQAHPLPRPVRKRPAHHPVIERSDRPTVLMVTTCVKGRRALLARDEIQALLVRVWRMAEHWQVNRYVLMPDHVHLFCCPANRETPYSRWREFWRATVTKEWPFPAEKPIWLRDDWDTQIRDAAHFAEKWHYVRNNPVRKGLVARAEDWPYCGEVFPFTWIER
jgi:putative transposase